VPNHGMVAGLSVRPEATRWGLWARFSSVTTTRSVSTSTLVERFSRLRKIVLGCAHSYSFPMRRAISR